MKAVILAGGVGNRVFPLAVNRPKPMFKVLEKPLLQHVLETTKEAGLKDFIIVTGHNSEQIKEFLGDGHSLGVNVDYTYQKEALGTANALETTRNMVEDSFLVLNADDIFESSLIKNMIKVSQGADAEIVLSCKPVKDTWKWGIIKMDDEKVTKIVEKPPKGEEPSNLAVIGAYIMTKDIFDYYDRIPVSDHQYEDAIQKFIENGRGVGAVKYDGVFAAYKYPWDLFTINEFLMDKHLKKQIIENGADVSEKAEIEGNVWIRQGTKVLENTCIKGPCYIGSNSMVGNNCLIWNYSSIGNNCVVGFSSEIKHSLVGDQCWFHTNYIGDSIVSDRCSFGARTITANFRFDEQNVVLRINDRMVDSGRDKLGAIIGDDCKMGIGCCLMPGVRIGPNSIVGPNVCLHDDLEPNRIILVDKKSYVKKENKIMVSPEKTQELLARLKKYKNI